MSKILFICKQGQSYGSYGYSRKFSGLYNSALLVSNMLSDNGNDSNVKIVNDNNDIDRVVTEHKPDICIIEAYWVVPEKFEILSKLHPNVKWVIRIHSEIPFWATEGVAMEWTLKYLDFPNVILAPNAKRLYNDILTVLKTKYNSDLHKKLVYLPNYYPDNFRKVKPLSFNETIDIGCFGAIRPMKNQLIQAIAAIKYAEENNLILRFHINGTRVEAGGEPILKNIRNLFKNSSNRFELIEHTWMPHNEFLDLLADMDVNLQVSFSESFNIVTADSVIAGSPVVTSSEIGWIHRFFYADPTNTDSIVRKINVAILFGKVGTLLNRMLLRSFVSESRKQWLKFVKV